jgi:23S rRNA (pseudouridine1915-N3)-methyltransferase
MLHIRIITVGKKQHDIYADAIAEYSKRLDHYCSISWEIISPDTKVEESNQIQKRLKNATLLLLDERGKQYTTEQIIQLLNNAQVHADNELTFIIGGAYGVDQNLYNRADHVISLGKLVYPHQLVRVILLEQLYRSFDTLRGGSYHHR